MKIRKIKIKKIVGKRKGLQIKYLLNMRRFFKVIVIISYSLLLPPPFLSNC